MSELHGSLKLTPETLEAIAQRAAELVLNDLNGIRTERYLNVVEAARLLSLSERKVREWARMGLMPHSRVDHGRKDPELVFAQAEIEAWYREKFDRSELRVSYDANAQKRRRQEMRERLRVLAQVGDPEAQGFVYFARSRLGGDLIKIGYSTNVEKRMESIFGDPLMVVPGGRELEKELHELFSYCRQEGEWFAPDPEILAYIATHRAALAAAANGNTPESG